MRGICTEEIIPFYFSSEENSAEYHSHLLEYLPGILYNCQQSSPLTFQHFYLLKLFAAKVKEMIVVNFLDIIPCFTCLALKFLGNFFMFEK